MSWDKLSMAERAKYIQLGVNNGITDLSFIRTSYNNLALGGKLNKFDGKSQPTQRISRVNYYNPITGQNYGETKPENMVQVTSFNQLTPEAQDQYMMAREKELPELVVTPQDSHSFTDIVADSYNNFEDTFGISGKDAASFIPYVGDAIDTYDIGRDVNNGNYLQAGIGLAALLLPNVIEKPLKSLYKGAKNAWRKFSRDINKSDRNLTYFYDLLEQVNYGSEVLKRDKYREQLLSNDLYTDKLSRETIRGRMEDAIRKLDDNQNDMFVQMLPIDKQREYISRRRNSPILRDNSAYNYYTLINDLDPSDISSVEKFIDNQSKSIRGVYTKGDEDYITFLTHADNSYNPTRRGGDMFYSRGLYTSNSDKVSAKFDKAVQDTNTKGYTAKLYHDFKIDPSLSIESQLQQLQDRIFEYNLGKKYIADIDNFRMNNPEIHAWESPYFGDNVKQRAYVNTSDKESKPVADIIELTESSEGGVRTGRFDANRDNTEGLFISQYPSLNEHNINHYTDIAYNNQPYSLNEKGRVAMHNYQKEMNNRLNKKEYTTDRATIIQNKSEIANRKLRRAFSNINRGALGVASIASVATGGAALFGKSESDFRHEEYKYLMDLSDEDFDKEYNSYMENRDQLKEEFIHVLDRVKAQRDYKKNNSNESSYAYGGTQEV